MDLLRASLVTLALVVPAACGAGNDAAVRTVGDASDVDEPADRLVSCGFGTFPRSALDGAPVADEAADPAASALRAHLAGPEGEPLYGADAGALRPLSRRDGRVVFAIAPPAGLEVEPPAVAVVERRDGAWSVTASSGGCVPRAVVQGQEAVDWTLDWRAPPPDPSSTEVPVLVHERQCASGEPATGRVLPPDVVYRPDAVVVTIAVEPVEPVDGDAACPGNPPTPYVLRLGEPLGDRPLLDGATDPPRVVPEEGNVTLVLSNQGPDATDLVVEVDGRTIVDERFEPAQHGYHPYPLRLDPGEHVVRARSASGVEGEQRFTVAEGERRWVSASWFGYADPPAWSMAVHDEAPGVA